MPPIKIKIQPEEGQEGQRPVQISLDIRKSLDGKIMIFDHRDIDIVIDSQNNKVVAFPKEEMSDEVYETQRKYFDFLAKKGVVDPSSIQGGDVFSSMQALLLDSYDNSVNSIQVLILATHNFIEQEKPRFETEEWLQNQLDDRYTYPADEDSTELGEIPQEPKKGSINPYSANYFNPGRY